MKDRHNRILRMLAELRESADEIFTIFTSGSCFRLYLILKALFPEAVACYSHRDGHWITKINERYYDIGGEIDPTFAIGNEYKETTDPTCLESAKIPRYSTTNPRTAAYSKYRRTT